MWPFQGAKTAIGKPAAYDKYFEHNSDDDELRISPARVKSLKKTLFYESSSYCEEQDFDIFTVCWDVKRLTEPPDNIAPLLPPASWGEPDIICIGLQNCIEEAAASWSVVFSQSVASYSPSYAPLSAEAPYDPNAACLLLVFMRNELHHLVHTYAHEDRGVAAVRFGFHHSSLCVVTVPNLNEAAESSPLPTPNDNAPLHHLRDVSEMALRRQKFRNLVENISFSGSSLTLDNHPFIIWLGAKDEKLLHELETERLAFDFLNQNRSDSEKFEFQPSFTYLNRLVNHKIDVRFRHRSFVPFDAAALPFVTEGSAITQPNKGSIAVLKAGTMRLVLELVDDEGLPIPCESSSELVLLRMSIPMVDVEKLKSLYQATWKVLKKAPPEEYPSVSVNRSQVGLKGPVRPWEPTLFKFKISNICKYELPASFSLYCVSDSGAYVIPLTKHSFHYNTTHGGALTARGLEQQTSDSRIKGGLKGATQPGYASTDPAPKLSGSQMKSFGSRLSSRSLLMGSVTSRSVSGFGANFLSRVLGGGGKKKNGSKTARETSASFAETPRQEPSETSANTAAADGQLTSDSAVNNAPGGPGGPTLVTPRIYGSTGATTPRGTSPRKIAPSFSLTKWIAANPMEGVAVSGKDAEVVVSIMLMEGVSTHCQCDPLTLVVRLDDCKRDVFVSIDPQIRPSLFGLSANDLVLLGQDPLVAADTSHKEAYRTPAKWLEENPTLAAGTVGQSLPMPKEIWNLFKFLHHSLIRSIDPRHETLPATWQDSTVPAKWFCLPVMLKDAAFPWTKAHHQVRAEMSVIVKALESNHQIPPECSVEAGLRVLEKWMLANPLPFVPRESLVNAEQDDGNMHIVCRAILLNLSTVSRNILMTTFSIMREILLYTAYTTPLMMNQLDSTKKPNSMHCADLLREDVTVASVLSKATRTELLSALLGEDVPTPKVNPPILIETLTEWTGRFIAGDAPRDTRNFFVRHFLQN